MLKGIYLDRPLYSFLLVEIRFFPQ